MVQSRIRSALFSFMLMQSALHSRVAIAQNLAKIADGQAVSVENMDVSITPPKGWEYRAPYLGKALVAQVPAGPVVYGKTTYQRNITLALIQEARPIDATEQGELVKKLQAEFGKAAGVSEFQVLEHRLTDYRGKKDAILVYTHFLLNGTPMSQMNIFVSGAERAALLTYTDLADEFQKNEEAMAQAWNAIMSIELKGVPPQRFAEFYPVLGGMGMLALALFCFVILRRRAARRMLEGAEGGLYDDEQSWGSDVALLSDFGPAEPAVMSHAVAHDVWDQATRVASSDHIPSPKKKKRRAQVQQSLVTSGF